MLLTKKIKSFSSGILTMSVLMLPTLPSIAYGARFDGRVDVWNSPLNIRECGSTSCQRTGRLLRDEVVFLSGPYSSSKWLQIPELGAYSNHSLDYVYGKYIREGRESLGTTSYPSAGYYGTITTNANLREGPMLQYDRLTTIPEGARVTVYGQNGHYLDIFWRTDLRQFSPTFRGYVHKNLVRPDEIFW